MCMWTKDCREQIPTAQGQTMSAEASLHTPQVLHPPDGGGFSCWRYNASALIIYLPWSPGDKRWCSTGSIPLEKRGTIFSVRSSWKERYCYPVSVPLVKRGTVIQCPFLLKREVLLSSVRSSWRATVPWLSIPHRRPLPAAWMCALDGAFPLVTG